MTDQTTDTTNDATNDATIDATVVRIWADVLKAEVDGPEIHFFDFGGHSIAAMRVITRLRREWDVAFPTRLIFDHPVLGDFTAQVRELVDRTAAGQPS